MRVKIELQCDTRDHSTTWVWPRWVTPTVQMVRDPSRGKGSEKRAARMAFVREYLKTNATPNEHSLIEEMRKAGLYAPTTYWQDCRHGIRQMIRTILAET